MNISEVLTLITDLIKALVWPITIISVLLIFKKNLIDLFDRMGNIEGTVGNFTFKIEAKEQIQQTIKKAIDLEKEGKSEDIEKLIEDDTELISKALGLTNNDIKYLIDIKEGKQNSKWGKVHLAKAGLVTLEGGELTNAGNIIIDRFLKLNRKHR